MKNLWRIIASAALSPLVLIYFAKSRLRAAAAARLGGDVIFLYSQVAWDEVWQRPQEFAWRASARTPVIYCSPIQVHQWLFSLRGRWSAVREFGDGRELVVLSPLVFSGHYKSAVVFALNCWLMGSLAKGWLGSASAVYAVTNTPLAEPVLEEMFSTNGSPGMPLKRLTYDVIDDFPAFAWAPPFSRALERRLVRRVDSLFTGTHELTEMHAASRPDAEFIACGVDYEAFSTRVGKSPADLAHLPQPVIGYFGTISERIDLELIARIASEFPKATLAIIGPVHLNPDQLPKAENIHYLGLKRHEELPAFAQAFSAALIPFRVSAATVKLNPVKTLEYLAAGVPVVSTALPEVERFFSPPVYVARSHDEFIQHLRQAMEDRDPERISQGIAMAARASWEEMTRRMEQKILGTPAAAASG